MELVITGPPIAGESYTSYILRISSANCLTPLRLLSLAGIGARLTTSIEQTRCLAELCGVDTSLLASIQYAALPDRTGITFGSHHVRLHALASQGSKVCRQCLETLPVALQIWDLKAYVACHRHGSLLIDACTACGKKLSWKRANLDRCDCGSSLTDGPPQHVPEAVIRASAYISESADGCSSASTFDLDLACQVLGFFGTEHHIQHWRASVLAKPDAQAALKIVEAGAPVLLDWPFGLFEWMDARRNRVVAVPTLTEDFGPLPQRIERAFCRSSDRPVIDAVSQYLILRWTGQALRSDSTFFCERAASATMTVPEVAKRLRTSSPFVSRLFYAGELTGRQTRRGRRVFVTIDPESVDAYLSRQSTDLSMAELAQRLGILPTQAGLICKEQLLPYRRAVTRQRIVKFSDLMTFLQRLEALAVPKAQTRHGEYVSLASIPKRREVALNRVLRDVLTGALPLVKIKSTGAEFERFGVSVSHLPRKGAGDEPATSVKSAAKAIGTRPPMIPLLVQAGCLTGIVRSDGSLAKRGVTEDSIAVFRQKFCFLGDIATAWKTSRRHANKILRESGAKPLIEGDSDGRVSAVWSADVFNQLGLR